MKFEKLNEVIPYVMGGKPKILSMQPYNAVTLRLPGRHAKDTTPVGGDFVVCVDDADLDWTQHQFTHTDLFRDVERRGLSSFAQDRELMGYYLQVIQGADPEKFEMDRSLGGLLHGKTFLYAVQCLAVAEHRRYARFEPQFGGRFLPFRFAAGINEFLWTADEASAKQKYGRPAVERLEKERGTPILTKELFNK